MSKKNKSNNKKNKPNNKQNKFNDYLKEIKYDEKTKEYIKEMHELEDKNELISSIAFASIAIPIILVIAISVIQVVRVPFKVMAANNKKIEQKENLACSQSLEDTVTTSDKNGTDDMKNFNTKVYSYLNEYTNRTDSLNKAVTLNGGSRKGVNAYLISQILRNNGMDIPETTSNTKKLMNTLEDLGWEKIYDYNKLEEGDICFTTDLEGKPGSPSHSYIFMGWLEDNKTDYAYVCDGQVSEYGSTLHKRNIDFVTNSKDKFNFFMRKINK